MEPNFFDEVKEDMHEECSNYGQIEKIWVDKNSIGNVWIKFANKNTGAAAKIVEKLKGR